VGSSFFLSFFPLSFTSVRHHHHHHLLLLLSCFVFFFFYSVDPKKTFAKFRQNNEKIKYTIQYILSQYIFPIFLEKKSPTFKGKK